jgi:hypothetical protein
MRCCPRNHWGCYITYGINIISIFLNPNSFELWNTCGYMLALSSNAWGKTVKNLSGQSMSKFFPS